LRFVYGFNRAIHYGNGNKNVLRLESLQCMGPLINKLKGHIW
jgi:hypothetical protein